MFYKIKYSICDTSKKKKSSVYVPLMYDDGDDTTKPETFYIQPILVNEFSAIYDYRSYCRVLLSLWCRDCCWMMKSSVKSF